ncbi:MAG TPA: DEAD/DEAH box helicase, partial [Thermoanaerobaculia bacterium]|nr:DEAD/DEAH box helicase [Thermoanaerobaculia bacterium]
MGRKPGVRPEPENGRPAAAVASPATAAAPWDEAVRAHPKLGGELIHTLHLDAVAERSAVVEPPLPEALAAAVARSIGRLHRIDEPRQGEPLTLWAHQAEALAAARGGEDVLVTTPTASGKSLVFQLPVLEEAMAGRPGRALFLFPLKALGQDQKAKFEQLAALAGLSDGRGEKRKKKSDPDDPHVASCRIYDGDTPTTERATIRRDPPRVLITNPDMLHLAILGHWTSWTPFLRDLKWIVLDELHAYRGIFGCHFHHVLSRLLRLAGRLGAKPSIVASSATAANAGDFAAALTGRSFHWIERSGAPREARSLLLFRPESSPYSTALDLFVACLEAGLKTIVFTKARRITELLYSWLKRRDRRLASRVASYRSGFLAPERRKIEADLFSGRLDGVVSTSALEMGIDVGGLDACILVGYPGSVMATWQRSGRVGRSGRRSLTALVAMPDALDQYFLDHPDELVSRPCERLVVDPGNAPIARQHLVCAAAEEPLLVDGADAAYLAPHAAVIEELVDEGRLLEAVDGPGLFSLERRPQRNVSIRGSGDTFAIVSASSGRTIGTVDGVRVLHECHPGAVYLHRGRSWLVDELDLEKRRAVAERSDVDYYTTPLTDKETRILEVLEEKSDGPLHAWYGRVQVTERVVGYERRQIQGREVLSRHDLELPPLRFETTALWWAAPRAVEETMRRAGRHYMGGLHASEHATIALFPLLALCDRGDVGGISYPRHPQVGCGAVFVYDGHAGGAGIAAGGFTDLRRLLSRVAAMIDGCACEEGCPSCIQSPKCGNGNRPLDKQAASETLHLLLGDDEPAVAWGEAPVLDLERGAGWAREGEGEAEPEPAVPEAAAPANP